MSLNDPISDIFTGQTKIAVTGTQVALGSNIGLQNGVTVKADKNNAAAIFIGQGTVNNTGGGTGNGFMLYPGDTVSISVTAICFININGTAGDFVSWLAN